MNINKYTEKAQEAVLAAQQLAEQITIRRLNPSTSCWLSWISATASSLNC